MTGPPRPGHTWHVGADAVGLRLDSYLARADRIGSRQRASRALSRGQVFLNEREASLSDAAHRLTARDVVRVWLDRPGSAARRSFRQSAGPLDVLYEDAALFVVNKPAGLLSVPLDNLRGEKAATDFLKARVRGRSSLFVVHRIDQIGRASCRERV